MMSEKKTADYWFTIEPYIYVNITHKCILLYNTLDGTTITSDHIEVIALLRETLQKENCGVILLTSERYQQKNIHNFIRELREKYMGDIIDITLSEGKPVQLLPFFNYTNSIEPYKKNNFSRYKNSLIYLSEINIHVDHSIDVSKLITFLRSISGNPTFNIIGNISEVPEYSELLSFFNQHPSSKHMVCSYKNVTTLQPLFEHNFSYRISVCFPIDLPQWKNARQILLHQTLPIEYIFDVTSDEDTIQAEQMIEQFQIEKFRLNPIYTGNNLPFFEENVFLSEEDILSTPISIKDIFANQSMNIYEFGKINIMPNGDTYANVNHSILGNIYIHSIYEIIQKEIDEGGSWFRVRNQAPCHSCVYQWLCPPPSDYEITVGRSNLCHVSYS